MAKYRLAPFKGKKLKDSRHPVMLNVYHGRDVKRYSTGVACTIDQWNTDAERLNSNFKGYKAKNKVLNGVANQAETIMDEFTKYGRPFTFAAFHAEFRGKDIDVNTFYEVLMDELEANGKAGSLRIYRETQKLLTDFQSSKLSFLDITPAFLSRLEAYMRSERNYTGGGISVRFRNLRTILRRAIRDGFMPQSAYPFKTGFDNGYDLSKLRSSFNPRGLSASDMQRLKEFSSNCPDELQQSLNYFLFSYYARGISFTDMAHLKWDDIYDDRITYRRRKSDSLISIPISQALNTILESFREQHIIWVFPIFSEFHETAVQQRDRIKKCRSRFNRDLKEIQRILGFTLSISSYTARHTYAKALRENGISDEIISAGLGHADLKTTRHYLEKLGYSQVDTSDKLL